MEPMLTPVSNLGISFFILSIVTEECFERNGCQEKNVHKVKKVKINEMSSPRRLYKAFPLQQINFNDLAILYRLLHCNVKELFVNSSSRRVFVRNECLKE